MKKVYIIAEAGVNHNGDVELAKKLIVKAKEAGADCVKFQTYKTELIVTKTSPKANYQLNVTDPKESQFDMLKKLELGMEAYPELIELCNKIGIDFMSTPYTVQDADFLNSLGVIAFKIASGQLVELPFLKHIAQMGKPIILSTGMGTMQEVKEAVDTIRSNGKGHLTVLQCTTDYPSSIDDANINAMLTMRDVLKVDIGYSDHVENNYACYAAVALGAKMIEKHFTLDRTMPGPDHSSSLEIQEFEELVDGIRKIERSLGSPEKNPTPAELKNITGMRRSIVAIETIRKGELVSIEKIAFKRPLTGIPPKELDKVVNKKAACDIASDTQISFDMIA